MAEKRDQFTYEDLKREPGNLIEARDWNTAMWAIEEVGTRLTALGDAVPRNNGANTLTGPLTIEDALTVGNHVVIRSLGTDSPTATLEVAEKVQVGTDATINGTLSVGKDASINGNATITQNATITGNATVSGTLTVTEQVRIQKNAIPEGTNDYQLEIYSPNTRRVQDYVKIRFHQANQYYAWLGYHGLAANTAGEFVFFDLNAKKEAKVRAGALTCTADADVQGGLEVAGALKVSSYLTVEGGIDVTDIVTAKDVYLDGTSVAEMLRNWRAKEETPIAWKTVEHQFQPHTIAIEVAPNGQTISLRGLTVPAEPDMPMAREQILSLHGVVEIPVHFIPPIDGGSISGQERLLCQVVSLSLEPVYTWPQPQDATQHWSLRAIEVAAPPWARSDHDLAKEWRRRQRARQDLSTRIEALRLSHQGSAAEIADLQALSTQLGQLDTTMEWWKRAPGSTSNADQSTADPEVEEQQKAQLETQLDTLITQLITREKQAPGSALEIAATEYETIHSQYEQKKKEILIETVDPLLQAIYSDYIGRSHFAATPLQDIKRYNTYEDIHRELSRYTSPNAWGGITIKTDSAASTSVMLDVRKVAAALEEEKRKNEALDIEYTPQITRAKTLLEQEERQYRAAAKKREVSIPGDLDPQWQQLWAQLDHIERDIAAQRRALPVPARVRGFSELAPWTLRLLIIYATRMETPPVTASRGLPTRVPMRLTA